MSQLSLTSAAFHNDVHRICARLRRETPIATGKLFLIRSCYYVTRYADTERILSEGQLVKSPRNAKDQSGRSTQLWMPATFRVIMNSMLTSDDPDHRRLRNLVHKAFTPRRIEQLGELIQTVTDELLDELLAAGRGDLVTAFAQPLPVRIIAELIGVPEQDRPAFVRWTQAIVRNPTPLNLLRMIQAIRRFLAYIDELAERRRREPRDDLMTGLVEAEADGDRLSREELQSMVLLLLTAGHETTVSLIANGVFALLRNPEQLALLREQPQLISSAVEELLRFDGPLVTTELSYAKQQIEIEGHVIPQGAMTLPLLISANRDEQAFERADELDITRSPNKHLAFGKGIHYCLGAPLARLEGKIALDSLLARAPRLRLAVPPEQVRYRDVLLLNKLDALPVLV